MNLATVIAILVVAVIFIAIIVRQIKKMKSGACSCDCAVCGGCCKSCVSRPAAEDQE